METRYPSDLAMPVCSIYFCASKTTASVLSFILELLDPSGLTLLYFHLIKEFVAFHCLT